MMISYTDWYIIAEIMSGPMQIFDITAKEVCPRRENGDLGGEGTGDIMAPRDTVSLCKYHCYKPNQKLSQ